MECDVLHEKEEEQLEVCDEMDDFLSPSKDEKKWLIVNNSIDPKKYNDLLHEVESLKSIIIEMHKLMMIQNENISKIGDNIDRMDVNMEFVTKELLILRDSRESNKYSLLRDYLFPALKVAGTYTPFLMVLSSKTGMTYSMVCFLLSKIVG